jgi:hypothetical protein
VTIAGNVARLACPAVENVAGLRHGWTSQPCHSEKVSSEKVSGTFFSNTPVLQAFLDFPEKGS